MKNVRNQRLRNTSQSWLSVQSPIVSNYKKHTVQESILVLQLNRQNTHLEQRFQVRFAKELGRVKHLAATDIPRDAGPKFLVFLRNVEGFHSSVALDQNSCIFKAAVIFKPWRIGVKHGLLKAQNNIVVDLAHKKW